MDNKKREIVWINTGVSESIHMQGDEEPDLSLSAVGKTEKEFVVEEVKTINKIGTHSTSVSRK